MPKLFIDRATPQAIQYVATDYLSRKVEAMTYNFDPDRWYENELSIIHSKYLAGKITRNERALAVEELDRKYKDMWNRLDGSYQIPK